jgi:hypothetical protein
VAVPKKLPEIELSSIKLGTRDTRLKIPCRAANLMAQTYGKMPKDGSNEVILMEYSHFLAQFIEYWPDNDLRYHPNFQGFLRSPLAKDRLLSLADYLVATVPTSKQEIYQSKDFNQI